jgi:hypothetical protein
MLLTQAWRASACHGLQGRHGDLRVSAVADTKFGTSPCSYPVGSHPPAPVSLLCRILRAGVIGCRGLSAFVFADNVMDRRAYLSDPEEIFTFVPALNRATTNQPRTVGLEVSYLLGK